MTDNGQCYAVQAASGLVLRTIDHPSCFESVPSPDGRYLAIVRTYQGSLEVGTVLETSGWTSVGISWGSLGAGAAFSPDGRYFFGDEYSGPGGLVTRVFDVETWTEVRSLPGFRASASPDSGLVALRSSWTPSGSIHLFRLEDGEDVTPPSGFLDTRAHLLGNEWIALATGDSIVIETLSEPPEVLATLAAPGAQALALSPDASTLVALYDGGQDETVVGLWEAAGFSPLSYWPIASPAGQRARIGFTSNDSLTTSVADDGRIDLWSVPDGQPLAALNTDRGLYTPLVFSPDGTAVVGGFARTGNVRAWSSADGSPLGVIAGNSYLTSLAFSDDGQYLVGGGDRLLVWSWPDGTAQQSLDEATVDVATSSRDVVAQRTRDEVRLRSLPDLAILRAIPESGPIAFSPDGSLIAVGADVFDVDSGAQVQSFEPAPYDVAAFAPDEATVVLAHYSQREFRSIVDRFDISTGERVARFGAPLYGNWLTSLSFSPDGSQLAETSAVPTPSGPANAHLRFWDGYETLYSEYSEDLGKDFSHVRYSPDGDSVALAVSQVNWRAGNTAEKVFGLVLAKSAGAERR